MGLTSHRIIAPVGIRLIHVLANLYETGLLPEPLMKLLWAKLRANMVSAHSNRYVECNAYYYNLVDIIGSQFPDAKFIFVVRAPRPFIVSYINWERYQWEE